MKWQDPESEFDKFFKTYSNAYASAMRVNQDMMKKLTKIVQDVQNKITPEVLEKLAESGTYRTRDEQELIPNQQENTREQSRDSTQH